MTETNNIGLMGHSLSSLVRWHKESIPYPSHLCVLYHRFSKTQIALPWFYGEILFHIPFHEPPRCGLHNKWVLRLLRKKHLGRCFQISREQNHLLCWHIFQEVSAEAHFPKNPHLHHCNDPKRIANAYHHLCQYCQFPNHCQKSISNLISILGFSMCFVHGAFFGLLTLHCSLSFGCFCVFQSTMFPYNSFLQCY